jgi:hypothetical protein
MANDVNCRCKCPRCTIRSLRSPAVIITVGVLFLLDQMHGSTFAFRNTWPMILIVMGAISLASALAPMDGHLEEPVNAVPPVPPAGSQGPFPGQGR